MSYIALVNTCNVSILAERSINKPNYTAGKALKKAFKLLKRVFKSKAVSKLDNNNNNKVKQQITVTRSETVTEQQQQQRYDTSILTTCSTLSAEECENELNELAELVATNKSVVAE